jgi:FMN phosphatase YigB (HAD superfamily)
LHEAHFLNDQLKRLRTGYESKYIKVTNLNNAKAMVDQLPNLVGEEFVTIVYNFIDTLSHARTDSKIMRELAEDEAAYRALTKSWFLHSPLLEAIRYLSSKNVKIVITTDHGSVHVDNPVKVQGGKDTTTNLRYKTARRIDYNPKEVFAVKDHSNTKLPKL